MQRDVYSKLIAKVKELQEYISGIGSTLTTVNSELETVNSELETVESTLTTKTTVTEITGSVPSEGPCAVPLPASTALRGWQFLVETSAGVWSDVNTVTYYTVNDNSVNLYLVGDSQIYRGHNYKLFIYTTPAEVSGT